MKHRFNFKIVGSGPTGLLLSIALSKFDCNIFLTDLLERDRLIDKDKTYAITHSTRKILSKFRIWEKLEPYLFGFDTLSIKDSVTSSSINLTISDLDDDISSEKNIGWDGIFKGKPLTTDLYKYRIDVYDIFGKHYNYLGDVHLIQ